TRVAGQPAATAPLPSRPTGRTGVHALASPSLLTIKPSSAPASAASTPRVAASAVVAALLTAPVNLASTLRQQRPPRSPPAPELAPRFTSTTARTINPSAVPIPISSVQATLILHLQPPVLRPRY